MSASGVVPWGLELITVLNPTRADGVVNGSWWRDSGQWWVAQAERGGYGGVGENWRKDSPLAGSGVELTPDVVRVRVISSMYANIRLVTVREGAIAVVPSSAMPGNKSFRVISPEVSRHRQDRTLVSGFPVEHVACH